MLRSPPPTVTDNQTLAGGGTSIRVRRVGFVRQPAALPGECQARQAITESRDLDPLLLSRVAMADRHCFIGESIEVDRDAERSADFVLAAVAPADVPPRLVVLHPELTPQRLDDLLR